MKNLLVSVLAIFFIAPVFFSCKDDDNNNDDGNYSNYPYSQLSPEDQKKKLAEDALSVLNELKGLENSKTIPLLIAFNYFSEIDSPGSEDDNEAVRLMQGTYEWNMQEQIWNEKSATGVLTFILPASLEALSTNNGKIEMAIEGTLQMPTKVTLTCYVDNIKTGDISYQMITSLSGVPTIATARFNIDPNYNFEMTAEQNGEKVASSFHLKNGTSDILTGSVNLSMDVEGIISGQNMEIGNDGKVEILLLDRLVLSGNIQMGNYLIENAKIKEKYNNLPWSEENDKAREEELAAAQNEYFTIVLADRKEKTKIADVKTRVKTETYGSTNYYEHVTTLQFNDNTVVDADVYFSTGFDNVIVAWKLFLNKFIPISE